MVPLNDSDYTPFTNVHKCTVQRVFEAGQYPVPSTHVTQYSPTFGAPVRLPCSKSPSQGRFVSITALHGTPPRRGLRALHPQTSRGHPTSASTNRSRTHVSRITQHEIRITHYASRFTFHVSHHASRITPRRASRYCITRWALWRPVRNSTRSAGR
jgi:hypothetical protein